MTITGTTQRRIEPGLPWVRVAGEAAREAEAPSEAGAPSGRAAPGATSVGVGVVRVPATSGLEAFPISGRLSRALDASVGSASCCLSIAMPLKQAFQTLLCPHMFRSSLKDS